MPIYCAIFAADAGFKYVNTGAPTQDFRTRKEAWSRPPMRPRDGGPYDAMLLTYEVVHITIAPGGRRRNSPQGIIPTGCPDQCSSELDWP